MTATYFAPPTSEHLARYRWAELETLQHAGLCPATLDKLKGKARKRTLQGALVRVLAWPCGTWCVLAMWPGYLGQPNKEGATSRSRAPDLSRSHLWACNPGLVELDLAALTEAYRLARFADKQGCLPVVDLRHERLPA